MRMELSGYDLRTRSYEEREYIHEVLQLVSVSS
jgi:hypothetical protein